MTRNDRSVLMGVGFALMGLGIGLIVGHIEAWVWFPIFAVGLALTEVFGSNRS